MIAPRVQSLPQAMSGPTQQALGGVTAQNVIEMVRAGLLEPEDGWAKVLDLASTHGFRSPSVKAFVVEAIKTAARAPGG